MIYTSHYSELLDGISRGDQIYIARRTGEISLARYSEEDVRPDISKTDVFDSNYLSGTAPEYDAFIALKKATEKGVGDGKSEE